MSLSLVLLVLFQAYWLKETYADEFRNLRRELDLILRETSFRRQVMRFAADSGFRFTTTLDTTGRVNVLMGSNRMADDGKANLQNVAITLRGDTASVPGAAAPRRISMVTDYRNREPENLKEIILTAPIFNPLGKADSLITQYRQALQEHKLSVAFTTQITKNSQLDSSLRRRMPNFGWMGSTLQFPDYSVVVFSFNQPMSHVLGKMVWPIIFALVMLAITTGAFVFLYRNLKAQHRLAQIKNEFIANITHELKTPIATVGVAIEALKNFSAINNPERTAEYLNISGMELQRLNLLVDKVLKLSMFEQDAMEIKTQPVNLSSLIAEVAATMRLQFEKANAEILLPLTEEALMVQADKTHLQSVLYNLLDNALKYSPQRPKITVNLSKQPGQIQLQVADNGVGIPAPYRQKVFDKFFRVPHGDTHNIKGYGLGLSYVHKVIALHGGSVSMEANEPKGTRVVVTLPAIA